MRRTVLFVSGGIEALPAIRTAREMGLTTAVVDRDPRAPGLLVADVGLVADAYSPPATRDAVLSHVRLGGRIDGVLCVAADAPHTVAAVAEALDLPGPSAEAARLATDKLAMKERFAADGVPVPWHRPVTTGEQLAALAREGSRPLVVKPVDSRGARGVVRLLPGVDPGAAFERARRESPTGRVLVEEFLPGPQLSSESLVIAGTAHTPTFSDRNYEHLDRFAPFVIEDGGDQPSRLPASVLEEARAVLDAAARSLGVRDGVVKGDLVVHRGRVVVIELAARLSGGAFCTDQIPLATGVDLVRHAIRQALGLPVDPAELEPRPQGGVSQRYVFAEPGVVVAIEGAERAAAMPGVVRCEVRVRPGECIPPTEAHPARPAMVIATGATREQATARARAAVAAIRIHTKPLENG